MKNWTMLALILIALLAGRYWPSEATARPAANGAQAEGYYTLVGTTPVYRTVTSGAEDALDLDTAIEPRATGGNPTVCLSGTFSDPGATAMVAIVLRNTAGNSTVAGVAWLGTLTASTSITYDTGRYSCDEIVGTDTRSVQFYDVSVLDVSAGTLQVQAWTSGSSPTSAQP